MPFDTGRTYAHKLAGAEINALSGRNFCTPTPPSPRLSIINEDETGARPFKGSFATTIG